MKYVYECGFCPAVGEPVEPGVSVGGSLKGGGQLSLPGGYTRDICAECMKRPYKDLILQGAHRDKGEKRGKPYRLSFEKNTWIDLFLDHHDNTAKG